MIGALKLLSPKVIKAIIKYVFEDNKLDITVRELKSKVRELEQKCTDNGFRITAVVDMVKGHTESVDKFDEKLKQIDKIAHPPAIDLNEWEQVKADMKKIRNKGAFKKLGK